MVGIAISLITTGYPARLNLYTAPEAMSPPPRMSTNGFIMPHFHDVSNAQNHRVYRYRRQYHH